MHIVDEFEPKEIWALILQVFSDTTQGPLNRDGFADYLFSDETGEREQFERKQPGEIFSDFNGVEMQLMKEVEIIRRTSLIVEGIVTPTSNGESQLWMLNANSRVMRPGHKYPIPYSRYERWLWDIEDAGIKVWRTNDKYGTADAISARMKQVLKPTPNALARHLKPMAKFHANPYVQTLMGIKGVNLGPEKAEALMSVFDTPYQIFTTDAQFISEMVPGIGLKTATDLLSAIGRARKNE